MKNKNKSNCMTLKETENTHVCIPHMAPKILLLIVNASAVWDPYILIVCTKLQQVV